MKRSAHEKTRIGLIQMEISEDPGDNLERAIRLAGEAAGQGAEIICLPELFRTRYFPQDECADMQALSETIPGDSTRAFSAFAREHGVVVIVPIFEKGESGAFHNTAVVIDSDGGLLPVYRKVHVPFDLLFYEKHYFAPGDGFRVYDTAPARFAVLICYDQWFPEAARAATLMGAEIIFYPTAIGWVGEERTPADGDWREAWEMVQRGHAISNGVHVAAVNRAGQEGDLSFWGGSFAADAFGNVIARAGEGEEVLIADLDLSMNNRVREGWGFLKNRRPETYGILTRPVGQEYPSAADLPGTPKKLGFSMPAEWDLHDTVWLAWPHDPETFSDIPAVEEAYLGIISALSPDERVNLLVRDSSMELKVSGMLAGAGIDPGQVTLSLFDYADVWFRDYGPTFVRNKADHTLGMVAWEFNAWGNKYPGLVRDNRIPTCLNNRLGLPLFRPGIVLEGGSIDVNGMGTVLTTEQCLLNPNRNPGLPKGEVESWLRQFLGVSTVIWLKGGIAGDDTDGHIDDIARFVNPSTVVYVTEDDEGDENYRILLENERLLGAARDQDGNPLKILPMPMPGQVGDSARLPASYLNFYIGNKTVLVPTFADPNDEVALGILMNAFPERKVTGIDCRALVEGMGAIHCITQQQPRV